MWWWGLWWQSVCVGGVYSFCKGGSCNSCRRTIVKSVMGVVVVWWCGCVGGGVGSFVVGVVVVVIVVVVA